jgi:hypothetical protein
MTISFEFIPIFTSPTNVPFCLIEHDEKKKTRINKEKAKIFTLIFLPLGSNKDYERLERILSKSMCLRALNYSYSFKGGDRFRILGLVGAE